MRQTKLIALLKNLTALEMKHFGEFVGSPFFNKDKRLWTIVQLLRKHHPEFTTRTLVKEQVFEKLFPNQRISLSLQNKMLHTISSLLEDFLVWNRLQQQPNKKAFLLLESLKERGMDKQFFSKAEKLRLEFADQQVGDMDSHYANYYLNFLIYGHPNLQKSKGTEYFQNFNLSLDHFFLGSKFKSIAAARSTKSSSQRDFDFLDESQLFELVGEHQVKGPTKAYYLLAKAFGQEFTTETYFDLKEFILNATNSFGAEFIDIYQLLFNYGIYCPLRENRNEELFQLYIFGIDNDLLLEDGHIVEVNFNNIVILACKLGRFDWVKSFLKEKLDLIYSESRKNVEVYSDAYISYSEGDYEEAVRKLLNGDLELTIQSYKLNSKVLLVKSYYFLDDFDNLYRFMDNFSVYLRRNTVKISKVRQRELLNFLSYLKKLYQALDDKKELLQLRILIEKDMVYSKNWLTGQIDEKT